MESFSARAGAEFFLFKSIYFGGLASFLILVNNYFANSDPGISIFTVLMLFGVIFPYLLIGGFFVLKNVTTSLEINRSNLVVGRIGIFKNRNIEILRNEVAAVSLNDSHWKFEFTIQTKTGKTIRVSSFMLVKNSDNWLEVRPNSIAPDGPRADLNRSLAFTMAKVLNVPIHTNQVDPSFDPLVKNQ